jgi:hypothetical protein
VLNARQVQNESRAGTRTRQRPLCRTSPVRKVAQVKGRTSQSRQPPNQRVQSTPLRVEQDRPFLKRGSHYRLGLYVSHLHTSMLLLHYAIVRI